MAHIHELIDFTVNAFIVHNGKVLLINHKKLKKWLPVGGHIELDEDPEEALFREVQEECGLTIKLIGEKPPVIPALGTKFLHPPAFLDIHSIAGKHRHIGMTYIATTNSDRVILAPTEHCDIKWFTKDELNNPEYNLSPGIKYYAHYALKAAGSS